jgi:hypothetical protein
MSSRAARSKLPELEVPWVAFGDATSDKQTCCGDGEWQLKEGGRVIPVSSVRPDALCTQL